MSTRSRSPILLVIAVLAATTIACAQLPSLVAPQPTATAVTAPPTVVQVVVTEEEQTLIELYQRTIPGVVSIQALRRDDQDQISGGSGSGFVFDSFGHIATNAHVVRDAEFIDVVHSDGTISPARLIGLDDDSDLAVVKTDMPTGEWVPLPLGDSDVVVPGQQVVAIGNPFGRQSSITSGIVSAMGRTIASLTPFSIPQAIQTDAAINPGNSGGPLLNLQGEVIGVNAQIASAVRANAGVGFAIPVNIVARVVPVLIAEGEFAWPWLGVEGSSLTPRVAQGNELDASQGAYIAGVVPDSPAADAGLRGVSGETEVDGLPVPIGGDVVVAVDGDAVHNMDDLILFVSQREIGEQVTLTVLRDGGETEIAVTLTARPDDLPSRRP